MSEIIRAIGSTDFFPGLLSWLGIDTLASDPLALLYQPDQRPLVLYHNYGEASYQHHVRDYIDTGIYVLDPFYRASVEQQRQGIAMLSDVAPDEFEQTEFFTRYYLPLKLHHEITIQVPLCEHSFIHLSLDANEGSEDACHNVLAARLDILTALLFQHGQQQLQALGSQQFVAQSVQQALNNFGSSLLTPKEQELVRLMLQGHSNQSAAERLQVAHSTVKSHRKSIYQKLDITNQSELFYLFLDSLPHLSADEPDPLSQYLAPAAPPPKGG
ncbi:helix-turn-helix transcriptional regulator [Microbulbifer sp. 2201CG32-9]|uniref:helix-turn-helix transcriptional regulator n=1 Tax=Microbulbifer sp. 2201CG32-9 TaxID=3232309 RepID=UPI00345BFCCF